MRVVTDARETREGLRALRQELARQLGKPKSQLWIFPGGGRDQLPTWYRQTSGRPLSVGMGDEGSWGIRTPILIACTPLAKVMTPTVEINVPIGDGAAHRNVNGCFCVAHGGQFLLAHRGSSLTVTPLKVPKEAVHQYFAKWLQVVADGDRETPAIIVGSLGPQLTAHMASFAVAVADLKSKWATNKGDPVKVFHSLGWRENIKFSKEIERVLSPSVKTFEYRHGPIQTSLQKALINFLPSNCYVVLNNHIDLGILHDKDLSAIFEVKTDVGQQVYSGVGQLLCYRQQFAQPKTPLFLVLPTDALAAAERKRAGQMLRELGIELLMARDTTFVSWDGLPLIKLLSSLQVRKAR